MTTQRTVYVNGKFVPEAEARVSIFDSALISLRRMIFETTRTFTASHSAYAITLTDSMWDLGR